jgi:putative FmdB family regulatory protein
MPTYEYECRACNQRVEVIQKFSDAPLSTCEACGGSLRKLLFAAGVIYKGSGFYTTDYKNKENGKSSGSSNGSTASTETKSTEPSVKTEKTEKTETSTAKSD